MALVGFVLVRQSANPVARTLRLLLPVVMTWTVIVTANHYVLDAVARVAVVLAALFIAERLTGSRSPRLRGAPEPDGRSRPV